MGDRIKRDVISLRHQAIIPTYRFACDQICGNITKWGVDVYRSGVLNNYIYNLNLQVWRPSPTAKCPGDVRHYSLVGNNRFTSIDLYMRVAIVTPSPQHYIQFQPGDVLGFYVEKASDRKSGVAVITSPSRFTSEVVWYASIAPTVAISRSIYSIGSRGDLSSSTHAAPIISIDIGKNLINKSQILEVLHYS